MKTNETKNTKKAEFIVTIQGKKTERNLKQLDRINEWFKKYLDTETEEYTYNSNVTEYILSEYIINEFYWGKITSKYFFDDIVWNLADFDVNVKKVKNNIIVTFN